MVVLPVLATTILVSGICTSTWAQQWPAEGLYQIVSGRYVECCGFGGPFVHTLPDRFQGYVDLRINGSVAELRFLAPDMRTVFRTLHSGPGPGFTYSLSNGIVLPDHIVFGGGVPQPPLQFLHYVASNSPDGLIINGRVETEIAGADLPNEFMHSNVVAVLMPRTVIRVSEVEVCWSTISNQSYQVQYRPAFGTNDWMDLGSVVVGTGRTNCVADRIMPGEPARFYRVLTVR